ncbi:hypothetical protein HSBAA_19270 [Vreelandella sulfidaeris]|uniref:Glycosyltransferase 2-like domain-containing protein n=1 Tax=Vreelandella sulfidaeris TaxID=115553 RepID=A0A455U804_9GAMM|nr:hypothetical protein HSBAA_19270 [Halomonas sulfidaeris]
MTPLVSIITPVYNSEISLKQTVESVRFQNFKDWELILVDDNSQDNSYALAHELAENDSRIKVIKLSENSGAAVARNTAIAAAQGRYIAF